MDLNTSTNWSVGSQTNEEAESRSSLFGNSAVGSQNTPDSAAGAVRRGSDQHKSGHQSHIGKLTAVAALVGGAIFWSTSSSESTQPDIKDNAPTVASIASVPVATASIAEQPESPPVILAAATKTPAFFFDDNTDALKRSYLEVMSKTVEPASVTTDSPIVLDLASPATGAAEASVELQAMVSPPSVPGKSTTPANLTIDDSAASLIKQEKQTITFAEPASTTGLITSDAAERSPASTASETIMEVDTGKVSVMVAAGDTLSAILNNNGLNAQEMNELLTDEQIEQHLSNIDIGQIIEIEKNSAGHFTGLTTRANDNVRINVNSTAFGFEVSAIDLPVERHQQVVSGEIEQSLYLTAEQADLKQSTIMKLANIFQWELDFARETRKGDKFSLVYDKLYREGEYIGDGDILAAEFVRGGRAYSAVYLTKEDGTSGYYSPEGESKKRTFMRHPVDVVRITSKFNPNRIHPVLKTPRAHRGVDYGSPHGSPIYATADGTVEKSGPQGGYGNTVVLKHGQKFSTLYAHMSKISKNSVPGKRVKQGDVIGYVGRTGRVTGTHLHYEFRVNGEQIDPLKVDLPTSSPLEEKYRPQLAELTSRYVPLMTASLEELTDDRLASVLADGDLGDGTESPEIASANSQAEPSE